MERIIILGSPGSGKSTLARELSERLDLPVIHLDKLYWKSGWTERTKEEFDELLNKELEKDRWIIDGNYSRTLHLRLKSADTVIFFDYSKYLCLYRAVKRRITNHGKTRADMGEGCPERLDLEFLRYIWNFGKNNRKKLIDILSSEQDKNIIVFRHRKECEDFVAKSGKCR